MRGSVSRLTFTGLLGVLLTLSLAAQADAEFSIRQAQVRSAAEQLRLDAQVDFAFSEPVLEALDHGVPLTLVFQIQVRRADAWLWEDSLLDEHWRYTIRYRPLSQRYEIHRLPNGDGRDFVSRDTAIRALGELSDQVLMRRDRLDPNTDYVLQIKVFLDIEELPLPLRPMAYLTPSWNLSSGWTTWPFKP